MSYVSKWKNMAAYLPMNILRIVSEIGGIVDLVLEELKTFAD